MCNSAFFVYACNPFGVLGAAIAKTPRKSKICISARATLSAFWDSRWQKLEDVLCDSPLFVDARAQTTVFTMIFVHFWSEPGSGLSWPLLAPPGSQTPPRCLPQPAARNPHSQDSTARIPQPRFHKKDATTRILERKSFGV